jgi:glycosyltransferase involved in cell wall biosynthesis
MSVDWEVLVVDNNSKDPTHEVVEYLGRRYRGHPRCLFEPRQAKVYALTGIPPETHGDIEPPILATPDRTKCFTPRKKGPFPWRRV